MTKRRVSPFVDWSDDLTNCVFLFLPPVVGFAVFRLLCRQTKSAVENTGIERLIDLLAAASRTVLTLPPSSSRNGPCCSGGTHHVSVVGDFASRTPSASPGVYLTTLLISAPRSGGNNNNNSVPGPSSSFRIPPPSPTDFPRLSSSESSFATNPSMSVADPLPVPQPVTFPALQKLVRIVVAADQFLYLLDALAGPCTTVVLPRCFLRAASACVSLPVALAFASSDTALLEEPRFGARFRGLPLGPTASSLSSMGGVDPFDDVNKTYRELSANQEQQQQQHSSAKLEDALRRAYFRAKYVVLAANGASGYGGLNEVPEQPPSYDEIEQAVLPMLFHSVAVPSPAPRQEAPRLDAPYALLRLSGNLSGLDDVLVTTDLQRLPPVVAATRIWKAAVVPQGELVSGEYHNLVTACHLRILALCGSGATEFGNFFLSECNALTSIDLSGMTSLTSIGHGCMYRCLGLKYVDCYGLKCLRKVGERFFAASPNLCSIDLRGLTGLTEIGGGFLSSCDALTVVDLSGMSGLTSVGDQFLSECRYLRDVRWGTNQSPLTSIGTQFLWRCKSLEYADLRPLGAVRLIGEHFLSDCAKLVSVDLREFSLLQRISDHCLEQCPSLISVNLSGLHAVTHVGDNFLTSCTSLKALDLSGLTSLAFIGAYFLAGCTALKSVDYTAQGNVSRIDHHFMFRCTALTAVDLGAMSKVLSVADGFLDGCPMLHSVGTPHKRFVKLRPDFNWKSFGVKPPQASCSVA